MMRSRDVVAGALIALLALACAGGGGGLPMDVSLQDEATPAAPNAPLGGMSLAQRRLELERTQKDLTHFAATLDSLQLRREQNGLVLFKGFVDEYLGTHVDPMLATDMHSQHPELASLDAGIRFLEAELLTRLRSPSRAQQVIDDLERLYQGREDMLVDYPIGKKSTLKKGLDLLADRKWRG
jgi:hypothetical protein